MATNGFNGNPQQQIDEFVNELNGINSEASDERFVRKLVELLRKSATGSQNPLCNVEPEPRRGGATPTGELTR